MNASEREDNADEGEQTQVTATTRCSGRRRPAARRPLVTALRGLRSLAFAPVELKCWPAACSPGQARHAERASNARRRDSRTAPPTARAGADTLRVRLGARRPDLSQVLRHADRTPRRTRWHALHDLPAHVAPRLRLRPRQRRSRHPSAASLAWPQEHPAHQHTVRYTELAPDRFKDFWR